MSSCCFRVASLYVLVSYGLADLMGPYPIVYCACPTLFCNKPVGAQSSRRTCTLPAASTCTHSRSQTHLHTPPTHTHTPTNPPHPHTYAETHTCSHSDVNPPTHTHPRSLVPTFTRPQTPSRTATYVLLTTPFHPLFPLLISFLPPAQPYPHRHTPAHSHTSSHSYAVSHVLGYMDS